MLVARNNLWDDFFGLNDYHVNQYPTDIIEEENGYVKLTEYKKEFINNIARNNYNVFQKIYSEIKYLWHQFRGYKNQNQFIEDLYYKWTQAYNSNNKLNEQTSYHVSQNFSNEIDKALKNQLQSNTQIKARDYTPKILVNNGVENFPMLITQKHVKSIVYTLQEAENLGLPTKNINYHGLGKDLLIKAIDNLDNPQAIYKTNENNYLVLTEFKDNNGREIVVPIQINGKGRYNNVFIDENQIKSVYGRNNLTNYLNRNNFELIYQKNKELDFNEGIQYSNVANSFSNNSIAPSNEDVNTTKYSIQESESYSDSLNSTEKDSNGNKLTKEQQKYFKDSNVRVKSNLKPTNDSDVRYSQEDKTWQSYLNKKFKQSGTRTNLQDIKLSAVQKQVAPTAKNNALERTSNSIENNQQTLYNNIESESGINETVLERREDTNKIQESTLGIQEENAFSIDRYKQEETTIRQRGEVEYNQNDKIFADKVSIAKKHLFMMIQMHHMQVDYLI